MYVCGVDAKHFCAKSLGIRREKPFPNLAHVIYCTSFRTCVWHSKQRKQENNFGNSKIIFIALTRVIRYCEIEIYDFPRA